MSEPVVLARVVRSGLEESIHLGHVAVCDASGRLLASAGDPGRVVFGRSSLKPIQAAVSLGAIRDVLDPDEVAIMCGSHSGEPVHVDAVRKLLRRGGLGEQALQCPPAWPFRMEDAKAFDRPLSILHYCSGKHAGMLIACARSGWDIRTYLDVAHPLQRAVHHAFTETAGVPDPVVGVDGCGAPVFSAPLSAMATLFARLVTAAGGDAVGDGMRTAVEAMRAKPYLVAGRDRIDTALMQEVETLVVKIGAEGLVCVGVVDRGIGVAVRVDDGSSRAADPATLRALHLLEIVGNEQVEALEVFARPPVLGGGQPVGHVTSDFVLRRP